MKIPEFPSIDIQVSRLGKHEWAVSRLIQLAKDLPVMEIPLDHLNVWHKYENLTLREMAMHIKCVLKADLNFPIILDEDGDILDGRHRIMKSLIEGNKSIKAVRFDENPKPCRVID